MGRHQERLPAPDVARTLHFVDVTDDRRECPAMALFWAANPLAVTLRFAGNGVVVDWEFARDLLRLGMQGAVGDGAVMVTGGYRADGARVAVVHLSSPDGKASLEVPADEVVSFLLATHRLVPGGEEESARVRVALDLALTRILGAAA